MRLHALTILAAGLLLAAAGASFFRPSAMIEAGEALIEDDPDLQGHPQVARAGKLPTKDLPNWFIDLDIDHDGQIALSEWLQARKGLQEFREWDRNNDGFITAEEAVYKHHLMQVGHPKRAENYAAASAAPIHAGAEVLQNLRPGHPRLLVLDEDIVALEQQIERNPLVNAWYERLREEARRMLKEPPVEHTLIGPRLLDQSRKALRRISTLAGLYRIDGDRAKAERATQEMLAVAAFPDWNPAHFLDTAEMTAALAIGYDWLFSVLSKEDKKTIRTALIDKGLMPGLEVYQQPLGWHTARHNWNQVCNGGLTMGALAIADKDSALASKIINHGRQSIARAMHSFAPDGGWDEGPGYWNYATQYNVFYLAALQTALETDFGLKKMPGFAATGAFRVHIVGPTGRTFNFADGGDSPGGAPQMLWLARAFDLPEYAAHEYRLVGNRPNIFHLLWSSRPFRETALSELPPAPSVSKMCKLPCCAATGMIPKHFSSASAAATTRRITVTSISVPSCSTRSGSAGPWIWAATTMICLAISATSAGPTIGCARKATTLWPLTDKISIPKPERRY